MTYIDLKPAFRATGRGLLVDGPKGIGPNEAHHNAAFFNLGVPSSSKYRRQWLWVTGVETGWEISGTHAQSLDDRTFYPHNLKQNELRIDGAFPNQYEYDKFVEFVQVHHETSIGTKSGIAEDVAYDHKPVSFRMPEYRVNIKGGQPTSKNRLIYPAFMYDGFITSIEAGHERFRFAVPFSVTFTIADDYLQKNSVVTTSLINATLQRRYEQHFGDKVVWSNGGSIRSGSNPPSPADVFSDGKEAVKDFFTNLYDSGSDIVSGFFD